MFQVQLINKVVEWERRLQIEEEKRNNQKGKPYERISAASERKPSLAQKLRRAETRHPYDPCGEAEFS